ncbi:MAG: hypothetical protein WDN06_11180 [Asticcacaulis sp.]
MGLLNYYNYSATVGVCEASPSGVTQIGNCAASLSLNPGTASGLVGDTTTFTVTALDSGHQPTLTPQNLKWFLVQPGCGEGRFRHGHCHGRVGVIHAGHDYRDRSRDGRDRHGTLYGGGRQRRFGGNAGIDCARAVRRH